MRFLPFVFTIGSLLLFSCGSNVADDRSAILALIASQQEAWNQGDLPGFLEGYHRSPSITFVGAEVARGFEGLEARYQRAYGSREKMGKLEFSELEFQPLGPEAAYVIGLFALERTDDGGGAASGRFTILFRKTTAGWKIVHDHTSAD